MMVMLIIKFAILTGTNRIAITARKMRRNDPPNKMYQPITGLSWLPAQPYKNRRTPRNPKIKRIDCIMLKMRLVTINSCMLPFIFSYPRIYSFLKADLPAVER